MSDEAVFEALVATHRRELLAHCYRMLGSVQDAEDALQEALLGAWRGLAGFEDRSSSGAWLYRIATNACLHLLERRPRRMLSSDHGPPRQATDDLGEPIRGPVWLEPWVGEDPAAGYEEREGVELAFVAALQHLPPSRRAALILHEVLGYSAAEVAAMLESPTVSVKRALQHARRTVEERVPETSQRAELEALGDDGQRDLAATFIAAWERADVPALLQLLTEDARFSMPPLPAWFDGREEVGRFFSERIFATSWRLEPLRVNGQIGFACYQPVEIGAVNALTLRDGRITAITGFLDPELHRRLGLAR
jgi:RNA polymerase sigma-70 factor (TIGR02960 family)